MALQQTSGSTRALTLWHLVRVLAAIAAVIIVAGALNAAFGLHEMGPTYEIVVDPVGPMPY